MNKNILVYTKHEEIVKKVKDCVEKVKSEKALVGQNFYVEDTKGLIFDVEINWIWSTGNLTLKVVCDTFEGYGDKEPCCVILKDLTDKQIAGVFTDLIFKRMASIRKDIEKNRKETEKKEAENDIHKLKVEINRVITDLIEDVGGDTGLCPPLEYCDMAAFTSCRPCVISRSFKWGGHKFSISINTKDHSMNCLLINWLGLNKLIFAFKDPFTPYSDLSNICSIADAIVKTIKEEEKETEENTEWIRESLKNTISSLSCGKLCDQTIIKRYFCQDFFIEYRFGYCRGSGEFHLKHNDDEGNVTLLCKESALNTADNIAQIFYEEIKDFVRPIKNLEVSGDLEDEYIKKLVAARVNYICKNADSANKTRFELTINGKTFIITKFERNNNINIGLKEPSKKNSVCGYSYNTTCYTRKTIVDTFYKYVMNCLDGYGEVADVNKAWAECVLIKKRTEELHATEADYSSLAANYDKLLDEKKDLEEQVKTLKIRNVERADKITDLQSKEMSHCELEDICSEKDKTIEELKKQIEALNFDLNDYKTNCFGKTVNDLREQLKSLIDIKKNQDLIIEDQKRKLQIFDERATKYMQKYGDEVKERERNNMANSELYNEVMSKYKTIRKRVKRYGGYLADIERAYWDMDENINSNNGLAGIMIFKSKMEDILRNWKDLSQDED